MMDFKFKLKTKTLWIPVVILIVNFLIIGLVFSRMLVSNSNKTLKKKLTELLETEKRQLLTGLSLMTLTQTAGDAMLALEGNDDEIASDIVKQVKPMGLNGVYFTNVSGKVIYPNNAVLPEGFKKKLAGSPKVSGETNVSYYGSTMLGYSPIMDVETFAGFLVFQIDIPEEVIAFSQLALKGETLQNENNQNMLVSESIRGIYNTANADHNSFMKKSLLTISLILIPTLIIIIAVLGTTSNRIIRHIHRLLEAFNKQAEGDLTREVVVRSGDEIAELAQAFNHTNMKLNEIMHNIASNSDTISVSAIQLSGTSQNISNDAEEQYSKTMEAANSMQELRVSFIEVAQNAGSAADSARKANEIATKGGDVVAETIKGMDRISLSVKESAETIEALGERSQEIDEIVKVINDIAGQTNLLALNAAIEAARAGEQGRGFAVVADEVRKLAERTTSATSEIAAMIKGIQEDTGRAVESMHTGTAEVDAGVDLANQAGEALKQILEAVKSVTDVIHQINGAVERQSVASDEITENIDAVANITKQNIDNTKSSSESIVHLNDMASILKELVDGFKLKKDSNDNGSEIMDSRSISDYSETVPSP